MMSGEHGLHGGMKQRWTGLPLHTKIIVLIIAAFVAAMSATVPALFFVLQQDMRQQRIHQLASVRNLVDRILDDNLRTVKNYAILFSTDRQVKDNLYYFSELAGERIHPFHAIRHLATAFELPLVELYEREGRLVASSALPEQHGGDHSGEALVRMALEGRNGGGYEATPRGFLMKAVAPVAHDEGQQIGVIATGIMLDRDFAAMIGKITGGEAVIAGRRGEVVASTLTAVPGVLAPTADRITVGGVAYDVLRFPFGNTLEAHLGSVVVLSENHLSHFARRLLVTLIGILLTVSVVIAGVTLLSLRRVMAPVKELKKGAEIIGNGDFSHRLPVSSMDEIGELSAVFNRMAANLQKMRTVEAKLQHAQRLASIGEFTAGVAHELNNPIANITGLVKVAMKDLPPEHPVQEDLAIVVREANRSGAIVHDLLLYSRSSRPSLEEIDLNQLLDEAVAMVRAREARLPPEVSFTRTTLPEKDAVLFADPLQLSQVFRNLVENAAQAVGRGGEVAVTPRRGPEWLEVEVRDNGCGIAPEHLEKIFYPFFTTKRTGVGTGLGLAVSYTIVQSHGGEITVRSTPGVGSSFTVRLPLQRKREDR